MPLTILVATMTGTAEALAEDIQSEFAADRAIAIRLFEEIDPTDLLTSPLILVISSTYGTGDVPEPAESTLEALKMRRPNLSGITYGVVSLGDSSYVDTFARGGEHWDAALSACGAKRAGELLKVDCLTGDDPLDYARNWLAEWLNMVDNAALAEIASESSGRI